MTAQAELANAGYSTVDEFFALMLRGQRSIKGVTFEGEYEVDYKPTHTVFAEEKLSHAVKTPVRPCAEVLMPLYTFFPSMKRAEVTQGLLTKLPVELQRLILSWYLCGIRGRAFRRSLTASEELADTFEDIIHHDWGEPNHSARPPFRTLLMGRFWIYRYRNDYQNVHSCPFEEHNQADITAVMYRG
jgi:hypothetical protein